MRDGLIVTVSQSGPPPRLGVEARAVLRSLRIRRK
jgi:hypothetical protein